MERKTHSTRILIGSHHHQWQEFEYHQTRRSLILEYDWSTSSTITSESLVRYCIYNLPASQFFHKQTVLQRRQKEKLYEMAGSLRICSILFGIVLLGKHSISNGNAKFLLTPNVFCSYNVIVINLSQMILWLK